MADEIELKTAPADFRFPKTNQTRHCFTRYIEFHRCVAAKGDESNDCERFDRALCPGEWQAISVPRVTFCSFFDVLKLLQKIAEASNGQADNGSDNAKRERPVPDLCVICLEHEYNAVFLPCAHMCCCTTCSSQLSNCPLCRRRIECAEMLDEDTYVG